MPSDEESYADSVAVILEREQIDLQWMEPDMPGDPRKEVESFDSVFGETINPPIHPIRALRAVMSSGELGAVCHAVANGTAGLGYKIVPRTKAQVGGPNLDDPTTWSPEMRAEHDRLEAFVQAGFHGKGVQSLRQGFMEQEHDRVILGWGGVLVHRDQAKDGEFMPPPPRALGRFQAVRARFTKPDAKITPTPVPILAQDGRVLWIEEHRHFRRLLLANAQSKILATSTGRPVWFKEYGDWRNMDARTGHRSSSYKRMPPTKPLQPGMYKPGSLKGTDAVPATEVMTWATTFPGADPYGVSGWHSELLSVDTDREAAQLLLSYLKSGLHSVILAASTRPFDQETAKNAIHEIDSLGRGRKGMGSLVLLSLVPGDSGSATAAQSVRTAFDPNSQQDRGRILFHELNSKIPVEIMNGELKKAAGESYARAERVPDLILGKSGQYNFATAAAAWKTVNRLRFSPHHEERAAFLNRLIVEMGILHWSLQVLSPEWSDPPPTTGLATIAGQVGGLSPNMALRLLLDTVDVQYRPFEEWWGEVPMPVIVEILKSSDPVGMLRLFGYEEQANIAEKTGVGDVMKGVAGGLAKINDEITKTTEERGAKA